MECPPSKSEDKSFSIKDKLKKKMLQQIRKTFKEDKKAELERQKKAEGEQKFREEELKEMSDKLREQAKERRRMAGESDSEEDLSPLSSLWRSERDREREKHLSGEIRRSKEEECGESKRDKSVERERTRKRERS